MKYNCPLDNEEFQQKRVVIMIFSAFPFAPELYLDPGSGSIVLQMIIAAILGAGVIIRSQWSKIKGWFGIKPAKDDDSDSEEDNGGS
jgi:hypothetical protein